MFSMFFEGLTSTMKAWQRWLFHGFQLIVGGLMIVLWILWANGVIGWLGWIGGSFVAVFLCPLLVVYPVIYWFIEGTWPLTYMILFAGTFGTLIIGVLAWIAWLWKSI